MARLTLGLMLFGVVLAALPAPAAAQATGSITGRVSDVATGSGLSGVVISAYTAAHTYAGATISNASGDYALSGLLAGNYYIETYNVLGYFDECYDNVPKPSGGCSASSAIAIVNVAAGGVTSGIDFALVLGATIAGIVTDANSGAPLRDVKVWVYDSSGNIAGSAFTDASGAYTVNGLPTGTYYAHTWNNLGYLDERYNNVPCEGSCFPYTAGTAISATIGVTTSGVNFGLTLLGTITGTVRAAGTGTPLVNVEMGIYDASGNQLGYLYTNASGTYTKIGLPTGTYYVRTKNNIGYVDELYDNIPCPNWLCVPTAGTGVAVTAGATTSGIDFSLDLGGTITGWVRDELGGLPYDGATVYVYDSTGASMGAAFYSSGQYSKTGLPTGTYYLRATAAGGYLLDELYNNLPCPNGACTVTAGTGVSVTAGSTTAGIDFSLAWGGLIHGRVTAAATGASLAGALVWVFDSAGVSVGVVTTSSSGTYSKPGLPTGTYFVKTSNGLGYADEVYQNLQCNPGIYCPPQATWTAVSVTAGATTSGIDFALESRGTVTGTVTDSRTGAPLYNVFVNFYGVDGGSAGSAATNSSGIYTRSSLPPGTYYLRTSNSGGYVDELYNDLPCPNGTCTVTSGTGVTVTSGATTNAIDFALVLPGITGTVTNAATGAPIPGVSVSIYTSSGVSAGSVTTNASGVYTKTGLALGTYYVRTSNSLGYIDQQYLGQPSPGGAYPPLATGTLVSVTADVITSGIDLALTPGGTITGTVTDAASGTPLTGITVAAYNSTGTSQGSASTDASGVYTLRGLPAGASYLRTTVTGWYLAEQYDNQPCPGGTCPPLLAGTAVSVTAGATTSGIDFGLARLGTITGTVTDAATGSPLSSVTMYFYTASGGSAGSVTTSASGVYTKTGLAAGTYYVRTSNSLAYLDELYNNLPCPGGTCTVTAGTGVNVADGATVGGIDFALAVGGSITGTVTNAGSGAPLASVTVYVYMASGSSVGSVTTNASGAYSKTGLASGTYYVRTSNGQGFIDELYNNLPCPGGSCAVTSGAGVSVVAGAATAGVDFALEPGGTISGAVVSASTGAPLSGGDVTVYDARGSRVKTVSTNASGAYTVPGLPTGRYYVLAGYEDPAMEDHPYLEELYDNVLCWGNCLAVTAGTAVSVTAGATTGGIDFALTPGGTIAGTVTNAATGAPITTFVMQASATDGSGGRSFESFLSTGGYFIRGLPTGTYVVRTSYAWGYVNEQYNDQPCPGGECPPALLAQAVNVTVGEITSGIDFGLAPENEEGGGTPTGAVTGTVTDAATGAPLPGVSVSIYDADGLLVGSAVTTNASGVFTKAGLATGAYYLRTSNSLGYADEQYDDLPCPGGVCTVTAGTAVTVAEGATTGGIDFELSPGGLITGTVTDAATGSLLGSVTVTVLKPGAGAVGSYTTNASGVYAVGGLATGTYTLRTSNAVGYVDEQYDGQPCPGGGCPPATGATGVSVTTGATTADIDFSLAAGGAISGTVTDARSGAPLAGVSVSVHDAGGSLLGGAVTTNPLGMYFKTGLATGTYYLRTSNSLGYLDELHSGQPCPGGTCPPVTTGTGVGVTAGATTAGIDFALDELGSITGTVTNAASGTPLSGVTILIYNANGTSVGSSVSTNASGVYTKRGLAAGTYYVRTSNGQGYLDELYNDVPCPGGACAVASGAGVAVAAGATAGGIDFGLAAAVTGTLVGTVADAATGAPLAGVSVTVYSASGSPVGSAVTTDASGAYAKTGLATGSYYVRTSNGLGYVDELYSNLPCPLGDCPPFSTAPSVSVTAGSATSGIDFALAAGGTITGVVTDAATGAPIRNVSVEIYRSNGAQVGADLATDGSGAYSKTGLATGTYFVRTSNSRGYVDEVYDNRPCPGSTCPPLATASGVAVTAGSTTAGINFTLAAGGMITGKVTDASTGVPLDGVTVSAFSAGGGSAGQFTTNASGVYALAGLPAGAYYLRTSNTIGYVDEMHEGLPCAGGDCLPFSAGTAVPVAAGATTSGIDFGLDALGRISGTVTAAGTGAPLANVPVSIYDDGGTLVGTAVTTNAAGVYTKAGLAAGFYYVRTSNSLGYVDVLYGTVPCPGGDCPPVTTGTRVPVVAGTTASGIDMALAVGGSLSGTVTTAATGSPLANVKVSVYGAGGAPAGSATTNASGSYLATGLPSGAYYARTSNSIGYLDELYDNVPCPGGACTVTAGSAASVTAGATTGGIDFALAWGGVIVGTVTDAVTGVGLAGVTVSAFASSGVVVASAATNAAGGYTITGLAAGTYYLTTTNTLGYLDELFDNLPCPGGTCPPIAAGSGVSVGAGSTTSGVNFGLTVLGGISGVVTDAHTGAPLANVSVRAYTASGSSVGPSVTTNTAGAYTKTGLSAGTYYVRTSNSLGYVDEQYDNQPCPGGACPSASSGTGVTVAAGATTGGVDFALTPGGAITGSIVDAGTGVPIGSVSVQVFDAGGTAVGTSVSTNASGVYAKTGLPAGTYFVRTSNSAGYIDELFNDLPCPNGACTVTSGAGVSVTAGVSTGVVNFSLAPGGTITGKVTDTAGGGPLANISVRVYDAGGASLGSHLTNGSGVYALRGLPTGAYFVRTSNSVGYFDELYDNLPCPGSTCTVTSGSSVNVTAGSTTGGIDIGLDLAGTITGTVTDADTGVPLEGASVRVYDASGSAVGSSVTTNESGGYAKTGLQTGTYYVRTSGVGGHLDELYANLPCPNGACTVTSGTGVSVSAGATTRGIDFGVGWGGTITGTVTDAATGAPIGGVSVRVYDSSGSAVGSSVTTNASGVYTKAGLPTDTYFVRTSNSLGYVDELYAGLPCPPIVGCSVTAGTAVSVTAGRTTGGIDLALAAGGTITGMVTDETSGAPLSGVTVRIYGASGSTYVSATTNASGVYALAGLATGTYRARTLNSLGYVDEVYENLPCPGGACPSMSTGSGASVTAGATTGGVDFALAVQGTITGVVTQAGTSIPLAGVYVSVYTSGGTAAGGSVVTNASGTYTKTGLAAGTYYLRTSNSLGYLNEVYDNIPCAGGACPPATSGTAVSVTPGASTTGIDFGLVRMGGGSGGDFTGDRKSDILWHHVTLGEVWLWPMDGAVRLSETYVRTIADTTWEIRSQGDQDGDGDADLLWRNRVSGQVYFWPMNGAAPEGEIYVGTVDSAYDIVGTGDFDGDGNSDILWRHIIDGDVWVWLMDGATPLAQVYVDRVDPGYVVKGVGDFDADGKADIVWHHATLGEVWIWPMDGTTRLDQVWVGTVSDVGYQIQSVADFTGDGRADIVWWHTTRGEVWIWTMNGTTRVAETWVATVPETEYRIVGTGDYDGDGKADLVWHHATRGEVWMWLMNGTSRLSETWVANVPDTGYQIVKAK